LGISIVELENFVVDVSVLSEEIILERFLVLSKTKIRIIVTIKAIIIRMSFEAFVRLSQE
jgi:hypothetical protein